MSKITNSRHWLKYICPISIHKIYVCIHGHDMYAYKSCFVIAFVYQSGPFWLYARNGWRFLNIYFNDCNHCPIIVWSSFTIISFEFTLPLLSDLIRINDLPIFSILPNQSKIFDRPARSKPSSIDPIRWFIITTCLAGTMHYVERWISLGPCCKY